MKLITLNAWGGRVTDPFRSFLNKNSGHTDIFCFQEICHKDPDTKNGARSDLFEEITGDLPSFKGFFRPFVENNFGVASFVRGSLSVHDEGDIFVHKERGYDTKGKGAIEEARNIQYLALEHGDKKVTIVNFHGLWNGKGKTDTEDRLNQSKRIVAFLETIKGPKILCGDFNLLPDTQSLKMLEGHGMRNLIKEFGVTNIRTPLYTRGATSGLYADYILVSPEIQVNDFKILPDVVSDHAPLFLDFEVM